MKAQKIAAAILVGISLGGLHHPIFVDTAVARAAGPKAVAVARTRAIPKCTHHVDAAFTGASNGTASRPFKTIAAAVAAAPSGAVICVAEGVYPEQIAPGTKAFTLAGGFKSGERFKVRDSHLYRSKAQGNGTGSFVRIEDPGPTGNKLTAIDGFEITGYSQAIVRAFYVSQRFDITNNFIHDNVCAGDSLAGAGFSVDNVTGTIAGNVIRKNRCWRGGAGFVYDGLDENEVVLTRNLIDRNAGTEPGASHGGGLYLFGNRLTIRGNRFTGNTVTGWGAGLYVGAYPPGGQNTRARIEWNVYRDNRAGIFGGGFFCDDAAICTSDHEVFDRNCGGNAYVDSGEGGPTVAKFDHMTNVNARATGCGGAGVGLQVDHGTTETDAVSVVNSLFWGNKKNADLAASCSVGCNTVKINVAYSMVQKRYLDNGGVKVKFGAGILTPVDPRFVDPGKGNYHLKSKNGHWAPGGFVDDPVNSPALAKGDPASPNNASPACAGPRTELGAYGNSGEASCVK